MVILVSEAFVYYGSNGNGAFTIATIEKRMREREREREREGGGGRGV